MIIDNDAQCYKSRRDDIEIKNYDTPVGLAYQIVCSIII